MKERIVVSLFEDSEWQTGKCSIAITVQKWQVVLKYAQQGASHISWLDMLPACSPAHTMCNTGIMYNLPRFQEMIVDSSGFLDVFGKTSFCALSVAGNILSSFPC